MNILLLSRYGRLGASSRIRSYQYLTALEALGIHVTVAPLLDDDYLRDLYAKRPRRPGVIARAYLHRLGLLLTSRRYDLLWIEDELLPWLPAWTEQFLACLNTPYVVDYDDAMFHRYDEHTHRLVRTALGGKIDAVMRHAALVTVGNDYLANRARQAGAKRIEIIPTVVDLDRYHPAPPATERPFTVGWIGSPVTAKYLQGVREALTEVCRAPARVRLIGSGPVDLGAVGTVVRPWSEESEVTEIQACDIGIMPLPDAPWERGKCGYKLIQYMACGLPVIASPVGVNRDIVTDGENGFLAADTRGWAQALTALRDDPHLRRRMGQAGRRRVEAEYCVQVTAPRLAALLHSLKSSLGPASAQSRSVKDVNHPGESTRKNRHSLL